MTESRERTFGAGTHTSRGQRGRTSAHARSSSRPSRQSTSRSFGSPTAGHASSRPSLGARSHGPHPNRKPVSRTGGFDKPLLTRRRFLIGAAGAGVLAVAGAGGAFMINRSRRAEEADTVENVLTVPEAAVTTVDDLEYAEDSTAYMSKVMDVTLPYGSLVWENDGKVAACLIPGDDGTPLTQVGLLDLETGTLTTALSQAAGAAEGFEIYDVRATSHGALWIESDIMDGLWRVLSAKSDGESGLGEPVVMDEGLCEEWQTPTLAIVEDQGFWQVLPCLDGPCSTEDSVLMQATLGSADASVACTSHGRMACAPYGADGAVVVAPRTDTSSIHYQLTRIDVKTGQVTDTLALPRSMKPLEVAFGPTGFSFAFDAGYAYGDGIANIGTYTPDVESAPSGGDYSRVPWFNYSRVPTCAPAWCGPYFFVKSTRSVCGVDLGGSTYFAFDAEDGAQSFGDYLASSGAKDRIVTYASLHDEPVDGPEVKRCSVRIWAPVSA